MPKYLAPEPGRRRVLQSVALVALAGCADDASDASTPTATGPSPDAGTPSATGTAAADLDLREANVTAVELDERDDRRYEFSVTLYHDDDGESGYADWWQVETLDGERLGRRDLLHAHGTREFTRSATVEVPADVDCVVVRGHDQTHGYGGQAMLVAVETATTRPFRQGSDRQSTADESCP